MHTKSRNDVSYIEMGRSQTYTYEQKPFSVRFVETGIFCFESSQG